MLSKFNSLFLIIIALVCAPIMYGQTYGLQFNGIDKSLDNRTELNLTPNDYLTFQNEFEISFDYKIRRLNPNSNIGLFGYILRIINEDNNNIDLLSTIVTGTTNLKYSVVSGNLNTMVQADCPQEYFDNWINLKLKINLAKDNVIFYTPDAFYVLENVGFKTKDNFKIIFGANGFGKFKTSDVPTMAIKDLKIIEQGKLKYHWPLDEKKSSIATDRIKKEHAFVKNPIWLNLNHQIWKSNFNQEFDGKIMSAINEEKGELLLVGKTKLSIFSTSDNSIREIEYANRLEFSLSEYKAIYNSMNNKVYCYLVDSKPYYEFDIETREWNKIGDEQTVLETYFRHHNRYFNKRDSSIYLFGGYGRHKYNNEIRKIDIGSGSYVDLPTNDSIFNPRYLAGLGALNDTLYILGGYGSKSGNQLINPQSYYDLIGYSIKDSTLFKKFELPQIIDDMCVANTFWIDEDTRNYYTLVFEKSKFDGYLKLIKGNLNTPEINFVGNNIPFQFLDVKSTANLFYEARQSKLYAYTTYITDSLTTRVGIHSVHYPPNEYIEEIETVQKSKKNVYGYILIAVLTLIGIAGIVFFKRRKRKDNIVVINKEPEINAEIEKPSISIHDGIKNKTDYQLIFFGGFQVINKSSGDITKDFTPLLKELFLLIWLHTFKNNKGISTEKITEILWYDKSAKSARNNRAVNLAKLRSLLLELGDFKLSKSTGYWKNVFDESKVKSDYVDFLNLTSSKSNLNKQKIYQLLEITKKGQFLRNVQYDWLDEFKARVSDTTIDVLLYFANTCHINEEAEFIIHLADSIFIFDVTNEEAMTLKCKALYILGKHSHAEATYKKFSNEYSEMYGQDYEHSFIDILKTEQ